MRKVQFANNEYYHIYNRGVDKRSIVEEDVDSDRFMQSLRIFNTTEPVGSIYEYSFVEDAKQKGKPLVNIICFCLNPNHFHLILEQLEDKGVSRFIKSLSGGYTKYFNKKYKRVGTLLQGPFKAKHINDNDYLLHLTAYVNLNNHLHQLGNPVSKLVRSSWEEYKNKNSKGLCKKDIILEQFKTVREYENYALGTLPDMLAKREGYKEIEHLMFD